MEQHYFKSLIKFNKQQVNFIFIIALFFGSISFGQTAYTFNNTISGTILDNSTSATALVRTFNVTDNFTINDINVGFNTTHTWRGDIVATLTSPLGTVVNLITSSNDSDDNYDILLDDNGTGTLDNGTNDNTASPYYTRSVDLNVLTNFEGQNSLGTWTLRIWDVVSLDTGTFNRAQLQFLGTAAIDPCDATASGNLDTDGDNVSDICDLDDDNDGILDADEFNCTSSILNWEDHFVEGTSGNGTGGQDPTVATAVPPLVFNGVTLTISRTTNTTGNWKINNNYISYGYNWLQASIIGGQTVHTFNFSRAVNDLSFTLFDLDAGPNFQDELTIDIISDGAPYSLTPSDYTLATNISYTGNNTFLGRGVDENLILNISVPVDSMTIYYKQVGSNPSANQGMAIGDLSFCVPKDTDNDGIPDYKDTDSDNDGCSDAIEGGGSFTANDTSTLPGGSIGGSNDNLGITVDGDGVPTILGSPQATTAAVTDSGDNSACIDPCDATASGNLDTDGDNISDICDLDDDNDGILDVIENGNCLISEKEEISVLFSEDFGTGTARATNSNVISHLYDTNGAIPDGSYAVVSSLSSGLSQYNRTDQNGDIDANIDQFTGPAGGSSNGRYLSINMINTGNTEFYRQTLSDLIIGADYRYRLDLAGLCIGCADLPIFRLEIQNSVGTVLHSISSTSIGVANDDIWRRVVLNFTAAIDAVDIVIINDQPNGSAGNDVGVDNIVFGLLQCPDSFNDTDGDGIINSLDTDSDNDGCPDATEGINNLATIATLVGGSNGGSSANLGTTVNANGIPTAATGGTTAGTEITGQATTAGVTVSDVISSVAITSSPTPATVCVDGDITFTATPTGVRETDFIAAPGSIPAGDYIYNWYLGASTTSIGTGNTLTLNSVTTGMNGNDYRVEVTTVNNVCPTEETITLTVNAWTVALDSKTDVLCNGALTGAINITTTGGTGTLTYAWTGPNSFTSSSEDLTGLAAGDYNVVVTDANGCAASLASPVTITEPAAISISSAGVTTAIDCNGGTGTVTIVALGGTAPISYTFNSETNTTGVFTGVSAGTGQLYSITDANNCTAVTGTID
ncbi:proprotein convertase P-domain-containing protein, partial [Lutibacter flavus]